MKSVKNVKIHFTDPSIFNYIHSHDQEQNAVVTNIVLFKFNFTDEESWEC